MVGRHLSTDTRSKTKYHRMVSNPMQDTRQENKAQDPVSMTQTCTDEVRTPDNHEQVPPVSPDNHEADETGVRGQKEDFGVEQPVEQLEGSPTPLISGDRTASTVRWQTPSSRACRGKRGVPRNGPDWQQDTDVLCCPSCSTDFGHFTRRHHCRACGGVFCGNCSQKEHSLELYTDPQRVCDSCNSRIDEIQATARASMSSSDKLAKKSSLFIELRRKTKYIDSYLDEEPARDAQGEEIQSCFVWPKATAEHDENSKEERLRREEERQGSVLDLVSGLKSDASDIWKRWRLAKLKSC